MLKVLMRNKEITLNYGENTNKNFDKPKLIKELPFMWNTIKQILGYAPSNINLDIAQQNYYSELIIKNVENVPQSILVIVESFMSNNTI